MKFLHSGIRLIWISVIVILLDQLTKFLAIISLIPNKPLQILPFFNLTLTSNYGASYGFLASSKSAPLLLAGFAVVISFLILIWLLRIGKNNNWLAVALTLILGGALGNLIDRMHYGYVIDFIQLHYQEWYFAIFNVADTAITIGAIMLAIDVIFFTHKGKNPPP